MNDSIYYQVVSGEPLEFCRDWRDRAKVVEKAYSDYAESKGGVGFVRQHLDRFGGVIFTGKPPVGWKEHRTPCRDGTYFCKPVKRGEGATEGKVIQAEIDALPELPSDEEFLTRFGMARAADYEDGKGNVGTTSFVSAFSPVTIAWVNQGDSFWIVLPDFAARVAEMEARGWALTPREWVLPDGLVRASRAKYELAVAQEKVDKEIA